MEPVSRHYTTTTTTTTTSTRAPRMTPPPTEAKPATEAPLLKLPRFLETPHENPLIFFMLLFKNKLLRLIKPLPTAAPVDDKKQFKPFDQRIELADRMMERFLPLDNKLPCLTDRMRITGGSGVSVSGTYDDDYPDPKDLPVQVNQLKVVNKVHVPREILEDGSVTESTLMGLFPEISRAWLVMDNRIYIWNFETGGDVAFYDGLSDPICSAGLIKPKRGIKFDKISHLLVLTTPNDIVVLGVILVPITENESDELHLTRDFMYLVPTEGVPITVVQSTDKGRIFLGGQDGHLYELVYQTKIGWWGTRCIKINHTKTPLSFFVSDFLSGAFLNIDPISQIAVDNSRNILYTLTRGGTIEAFNLGVNGTCGPSRKATFYSTSLINFNQTCSTGAESKTEPDISPIIHILPLTESDSSQLGLVGVNKDGARLYFSTATSPRRSLLESIVERLRLFVSKVNPPDLSLLVYVRYPPSSLQPPESVTSAVHKFGSHIFATTNSTADQNKVWWFSSDYYPQRPHFNEEWQCLDMNSRVMAIAELKTNAKSLAPDEPNNMLAQQQNINPSRFVVVTLQGTQILEKLRPVDIFAKILTERWGPDSDEVKTYFSNLGLNQGCAMALILACSYLTHQAEVIEWATRAFFMYGGSPKEIVPSMPAQSKRLSLYGIPGSCPTEMTSTDNSSERPDVSATNTSLINDVFLIEMSPKHDGLYLYLTRILRPVWKKKLVMITRSPDMNEDVYLSNIHEDDACRIIARLRCLCQFLEGYTAFLSEPFCPIPSTEGAALEETAQYIPDRSLRFLEKSSLDAALFLIEHATQVFGLWKILCQHQFHAVVNLLSPDQKKLLSKACFRDIILGGMDICSALACTLIELYLSDDAPVHVISAKLREDCPSLYKPDNAAYSQVYELLVSARKVKDEERKVWMLRTAVKLCKQFKPQDMNYSSVCEQLVYHRCYDGLIELCSNVANQSDPHCLVSKIDKTTENRGASASYFTRSVAYKYFVDMFENIFKECQEGMLFDSMLFFEAPPSEKMLEEVINKCLDLKDEAAHYVVYDWLITRNLRSYIVKLGRPSFESYLLLSHPQDWTLHDLLWQCLELAGNHAQAAQILYKLATSREESINLNQRLNYLTKAVVCMRSDAIGCAPKLGIFLHELEDMVLVARVQKQILVKISNMVSTHAALAEAAVKQLNCNLLNATQLYTNFADPFNLWECKLTIFDCARYFNPELIKSTWNEIVREELNQCSTFSPDQQMMVVMSKVKALGKQHTTESPCFPLYYLVLELELLACRLNANKSHVHRSMESIGVSVNALLDIYYRIYSENCRCWPQEAYELHFIQVIADFADCSIANPLMRFDNDRKLIAVKMRQLISICRTALICKPTCLSYQQLLAKLETMLTNLDQI